MRDHNSKPTDKLVKRMRIPARKFDRLTHYLFRYPAKFHPPVARVLLERFTAPGQTVLDPFCGSGTVAVEARVLGRNVIATDVDPIAVFVTRSKTLTPVIPPLRRAAQVLLDQLSEMERRKPEYERRMFEDLTESGFRAAIRRYHLDVPQIPNITHWFRRYVIVDLTRILKQIQTGNLPSVHRHIFLQCLGAIIRNASNADPVPVSALEVTAHMKRRDAAGRLINPYVLFRRALERAIDGYEQFASQASRFSTTVKVKSADAREIDTHVASRVDAVITSPPYHNAVDYYRRHKLEMYWLGLVYDHQDRLELLQRYIGRSRVPKAHPVLRAELNGCETAARWEVLLRAHSSERADAFKHYLVSMRLCLNALAKRIPRGKPAVLVVGKSSWNGDQIPTVDLFKELGEDRYAVRELFWYPIKNRYMSYSRHNGASIDREYVLVLERR